MQITTTSTGSWKLRGTAAAFDAPGLLGHIAAVRQPLHIVRDGATGLLGTALGGEISAEVQDPRGGGHTLVATLPPLYPEWLGDRSFLETHGVRFPYVGGAMARGIATVEMVVALAQAGMLAFFGAGGLAAEEVASAVGRIQAALAGSGAAWGSNLIHSPHEPALEEAVADLYIKVGVRHVSASAFMRLTPAIVRYAYSGIGVDAQGNIQRPNHVFAKISRPEVAQQFMSPAPAKILTALVQQGKLTAAEANLAAQLPVAEDITVESDSGGHTDNRPLGALLPTILALRDRMVAQHGYPRPIRVGAAGSIGTPNAAAAAFAMGAAYVLTGSVNQSAQEAGISGLAKEMLAQAGVADVAMAPSPDMFELGVKVQVLKRGTLFAARAQTLYDTYLAHHDWDAVPADKRAKIEKEILGSSFADVWEQTRGFWQARSPKDVARATNDSRHMMALVFRWYVGLASHWAQAGTPERQLDYQIWCGPAQGAFNAWVAGTFLEPLANRTVVQIARNLMEGAAIVTRAHQLRTYGIDVPRVAFDYRPTPLG